VLLCVNEKRPEVLNKLYSAFEEGQEYDKNFPLLGPRSNMMLISMGLKDEHFTYITIHFNAEKKKDQDYCVKIMDRFSRTI
jgi:hypothetical protein